MNICDERHSAEYHVIYRGVKGSNYNPKWAVCSNCLENKPCFGDKEQILMVIPA